jgi:radical SAM enzyme (TIGR01210 family)
VTSLYPQEPTARSNWIAERRGAKNPIRADRAYAHLIERERMQDGSIAQAATIFLTNRECPWKCVMCDLWRNTVAIPQGSISAQIESSLAELPGADDVTVLKLYNSGSFFDVGAVPQSEWQNIASLCNRFDHVVVECHPRLVNTNVLRFADLLDGTLEVAMGLETSNSEALAKINKRITVADFVTAARFLRSHGIAVRTFLLVGVPFIPDDEQERWVRDSMRVASDAGSNVISLIPTRLGNGALDELMRAGECKEPKLCELEDALEFGLREISGRVFVDTWDLDRFCECRRCARLRIDRLQRMNLSTCFEARVECVCGS